MRKLTVLSSACLLVLTTAGCGSITGISGETEFACKAPRGVPCTSMSGVYANIRAGTVPGMQPPQATEPGGAAPQAANTATGPEPASHAAGAPRDPLDLSTPATMSTARQAQPGAFARVPPIAMNTPSSGTPVRTPERVLRIWIAPLEDREGTLHDQRYVYVHVERGQWLLEAFQENGSRAYAPVRRMPSSADRTPEDQPANARQAAQETARRNTPFLIPGAEPPTPGPGNQPENRE